VNWLNAESRAGGRCRFGTWVKIPALETVEILGRAGFDFIVIDMEHALHSLQTAYQGIVQAQAAGMAALVRMPDHSASMAQKLLDAGADGLLIPRVDSAEAARRALAGMCFPPQGSRGMGYTSRAALWGADSVASYLERGRSGVTRIAQLEDAEVIGQIDEICGVPGLDALFIGFGDLMLSTGLARNDPAILGMEQRVLAAAAGRGLPVGTAVQSPRDALACRDAGYGFVMVSADTTIFSLGARGIISELSAAS
jgi:2-dehydro-3-deoxyglucarate aldolase/4-hydroxy-2-oxoheptanedioate aldolase